MTRQALVEREKKRTKLVEQFANQRTELHGIINDSSKTEEEKFEARLALQKLPRNSAPSRHRNRCALTGRPRGTFRKFGIARNKLRELALKGDIPGVVKASW
ncbi:MAG: 30S ribosomal protein S14 [Burkholderiales bacterium]|nr:30S ribosomal protein S14 [Burkholderiales bacterium]